MPRIIIPFLFRPPIFFPRPKKDKNQMGPHKNLKNIVSGEKISCPKGDVLSQRVAITPPPHLKVFLPKKRPKNQFLVGWMDNPLFSFALYAVLIPILGFHESRPDSSSRPNLASFITIRDWGTGPRRKGKLREEGGKRRLICSWNTFTRRRSSRACSFKALSRKKERRKECGK